VFTVDARNLELRRNGVPVRIREQSFKVLVYLLEHRGELVGREDLRRVLWPADTFVDFDQSLNTAMMKLRDALGDVADAPLYIETIPKRGYRFIAPISQAAEQATETISPFSITPVMDGAPSIPLSTAADGPGDQLIAPVNSTDTVAVSISEPVVTKRPRFRMLVASLLAGLLAGAILLGVVLGFNLANSRDWLRHRSNPHVRSLAVLPLQNFSGDPTQEYFADGMTEELITELAE
jgi:DNA-binding winged helix-turn-helix (wHTH) protein